MNRSADGDRYEVFMPRANNENERRIVEADELTR